MKRTKKELKERKAKAAEIAAMYVAVAGGGDIEFRYSGEWKSSIGPDLESDLSLYRVIPAPPHQPIKKKTISAPKKREPKLTGPGGGERWLENVSPRVKGKRTEYRVLDTTTTKKKP